MLTSVTGVFESGVIELQEEPPAVERAKVIVTFLPEEPAMEKEARPGACEANREMLELLRSWEDEPLSEEEARILDEYPDFAAQHPLRLARQPDDEP